MSIQERSSRKKRRGIVTSDKADKSITVKITRKVKHPIYGKFISKVNQIMAHDEKNTCKIGDEVVVMETRPLSKNKCWRLVKILGEKE